MGIQKLRIMSNNLWWRDANSPEWEAMGADCSAAHRAEGFVRMYQQTQPDIIGLQESGARMTQYLMTVIAEGEAPYAMLWGKDTPIVYRKDKFELLDSDFLVYPEEVPGLEGCFNNLKTKSFCIAVLRLKQTGEVLIFATTHLWHRAGNPALKSYYPGSHEAKAWQLGCLVDRVEELQNQYGGCAVIVGDFNAYPDSMAVSAAKDRGFAHAHDVATEQADETSGLHACSEKGYDTVVKEGGFARSLDHILVRGNCTVRNYQRYYGEEYMPLSDHFPVWIDVEI